MGHNGTLFYPYKVRRVPPPHRRTGSWGGCCPLLDATLLMHCIRLHLRLLPWGPRAIKRPCIDLAYQDDQDDQDQNQNTRAEAPGDPGPRLVLAWAVLEPAAARSVPSWTYGRRPAPRAVLSARGAMPGELGMPLGPAATSSRLGLRAVRSQPSAIRGTDAFTLSSAFPLVATAEHELSPIRLSTWRLSDGPRNLRK